MPLIAGPEDHQQGDVQRWCLVERLVKAGEDVEHPAKYAIQFRSDKGEAQRPDQETTDGNHLRGQQAQGMAFQFLAAAGQQQGQAVQQVDGPVRDNGPGPEWHVVFPTEHQAADIVALVGDPSGETIGGEEQRRQQQ
ncbi:hypothetical protein D3C84_737880 [compost metagenome]